MGNPGTWVSCHFFFFSFSPKEIFFFRPDVYKLKFEGKTFYVIGTQKEVSDCFSKPVVVCVCVRARAQERGVSIKRAFSIVAPEQYHSEVYDANGSCMLNI